MRAFALLAAIFAAVLGISSALTDVRSRTTVTLFAPAYDERTSGSGCSPDGCIPENTRDNDLDPNSRWSCKGDLIEQRGGCQINYSFEDPQDIVRMRIAFHKGDERTVTLDVIVDGEAHSTITSRGDTLGYQNFLLNTEGTSDVLLRLADFTDKTDEWLSLAEVKFMVR